MSLKFLDENRSSSSCLIVHSHGICHRNIKLEHILYEDGSKDATIRLIDFGLSSRFDRAEKSRRAVRTAYTLSPEIAGGFGQYTEKTDIWSVGVVAWILLAGDAPFIRHEDDLKDKDKLDRLIRAQYTFGITWRGRGISSHAKEFVRRCLERHPSDRWTAKTALRYVESTWIPALEKEDVNKGSVALKRTVSFKRRSGMEKTEMAGIISMEDINRFCKYGMLKKTVLMTMAQTMDREDVERLREIFLAADTTDSGTISLLELKQAFCLINPDMDDETVESVFQGIDLDHSGEIHWAEFIAALSESYGLITMDRLAEAFDRIDSDGKGYICREDLKMILGKDYDDKLVDTMIDEADFKSNGKIDYEELIQLMFEDPVKGVEAVGDIDESLRSAGMGDIADSVGRNSFCSQD
uniref:Calmodulin n=2 Tax=Pseudictyota dubia TaxID=2749911 RepID=A0A7R9VK65_9STRA|mmetsp:Transcript_16765/g.31373  ORF Transcript_16765/g.31373 Transcript_16765/m.31373 type:complete len:410 (+) Transcript_16765:1552-2781(+)